MKTSIALLVVLVSAVTSLALADTFGSGANTFNIEFVNIGNPGNTADTTGDPNPAGSVAYAFRMGQFDISEQMIEKANMLGGLGVTKDTRGPDKPATSVSWNEAARFINWLNTSSGYHTAYKFAIQPGEVGYNPNADIQLWSSSDAGCDPNNLYRNNLAHYVLPSADEWYKAAFYDPTNALYYDYPTGSNSAPTAVAGGTAPGTAVYAQSGPADIMLAGGLSPYGTMGQGGNVEQWEETDYDGVNNGSSCCEFRGGFWASVAINLSNLARGGSTPNSENSNFGFRIASVTVAPEPSTLLLGAMTGLALLWPWRALR